MAQETKSIDSVSNYSLELRFFVSRSCARALLPLADSQWWKIAALIITASVKGKKLAGTIFIFISLPFIPSLSPPSTSLSSPSVAGRDCLPSACCLPSGDGWGALSFFCSLFLRPSRKVTFRGKVGGKFEVSAGNSQLRLRFRDSVWMLGVRARAYGKSSQLALITLEWSTINSHNLPLDLGHGYKVLRNGSAYSALTDDDPAKKAPQR